MLVDYERVVLELKGILASKKSHGGQALLADVARLEAEHQVVEGSMERAIRLYGFEIPGDLPRPTDPLALEGAGDGHSTDVESPASTTDQGGAHAHRDTQAGSGQGSVAA